MNDSASFEKNICITFTSRLVYFVRREAIVLLKVNKILYGISKATPDKHECYWKTTPIVGITKYSRYSALNCR